MRNFPERKALYDVFEGVIIGDDRNQALMPIACNADAPLYSGHMITRYALQYLGKPQYCIVPDLIALERGALLNGEEAWNFLINRSNLYPRADVFGYRNDGQDEMIVVKKLDLAIPPEILVYADENAKMPIARTRAFIGDVDILPERMRTYITHYETIKTWRLAIIHE